MPDHSLAKLLICSTYLIEGNGHKDQQRSLLCILAWTQSFSQSFIQLVIALGNLRLSGLGHKRVWFNPAGWMQGLLASREGGNYHVKRFYPFPSSFGAQIRCVESDTI